MVSRLDGKLFALAWRHGHIEVDWVGGYPFHGTLLSPEIPTNDSRARAVILGDLRDFDSHNLLVALSAYLSISRLVCPIIKTMHSHQIIHIAHLLVNDAS